MIISFTRLWTVLLNEQNQKEDTKGFPFNRPGMLTAPRVTTHPYHDRLIIKSSKRAKKNISIDNDHLSPNFSLSQRIELVPLFHSLLSPLSFSLLSSLSLSLYAWLYRCTSPMIHTALFCHCARNLRLII